MALKYQHIVVGFAVILAGSTLLLSRCSNNPYRPGETADNTLFGVFDRPPTKMDPAASYYLHEKRIIDNIYEMPFDYHFLKRPYELVPLTAEVVPEPVYRDRIGRVLPAEAPPETVAKVEYTVRIKPGILFADHPCFAKNAQGRPLYRKLTERDMRGIRSPMDFPQKGTRELTAEDYVFGIRRLADPRCACPILATLERYIAGLEDLRKNLTAQLAAERARRRAAGGASYNGSEDEQRSPILLDYLAAECPGVQVVDRTTFRITLSRKYPQILYWMAMHFFSPVPREALEFYAQAPLVSRQMVLNQWPVGTGPYYLREFDPNRSLTLERNPHFRGDVFPSEGESTDRADGFLKDAGRPIPFVQRAVLNLEKETIPYWSKFVQGYYDRAIVTPEAFERSINLGGNGEPTLSDDMRARGMTMQSTVEISLYYTGFNMVDDVVGGYTPEKQKLRQALSIALDYNEFLDIFYNGQGVAAQGPLAPGIFGMEQGEAAVNPYVDRWDPVRKRCVRRPIEEARRLMAEAGYPQGRTPDGRPLTLFLDHAMGGDPTFMTEYEWMRNRWRLLGVDLQERGTELKRFREKMDTGNAQVFRLAWSADYPDPENFLFLFYGPNAKIKGLGENNCNYMNAEYDTLFPKMESMPNGPARQAIIDKMVDLLRRDAPQCWGFHPLRYGLYHPWFGNGKPNQMSDNTIKYAHIDTAQRTKLQREWNRPRVLPVVLVEAALLFSLLPAIRLYRRREKEGAC